MRLQDRDKAAIWHPFTPSTSPEPLPIVKGEGIHLIDENGNAYIDAISSWWVNLHGHGHPYIAKRIYEQALVLEQVIFAGFTHLPAIELAERLLDYLPPHFSKIFYSDNGSTSTEVAIKMAIQYWWNRGEEQQRRKIVAFKNSYHGDTFGAMSLSDRGVFTLAFHDRLFEVVFIDTPNTGNITSILAQLKEEAPHTAAFIYEPLVQGAGGMHMYDPANLDEMLRVLKSEHVICIADEVMTGFGRTGKMLASDHAHEKPDIICLSKGLTGGTMALGVTAASETIVDAFKTSDPLKTFFHGHSFTANPLACTAALASLDLLEKAECQQAIAMIVESHTKFIQEYERSLGVRNLRQQGTILAFEIDKGKDEYLNSISATITRKSMEKGIYLRPLGNTVYIMPPYCVQPGELNRIYELLLQIAAEK